MLTRSRGPIGGLRGYMTPVAAYGGSPGLLRCGTYQDIGADHAARQEPERRRYVAPVGPIRLRRRVPRAPSAETARGAKTK